MLLPVEKEKFKRKIERKRDSRTRDIGIFQRKRMKKTKILNNEPETLEEDSSESALQIISTDEIIEDEIRHRKTPQPIEESNTSVVIRFYINCVF